MAIANAAAVAAPGAIVDNGGITLENSGYTWRYEYRPEFLGKFLVPFVIDASSVITWEIGKGKAALDFFNIADIFVGKDEVFLGFGRPNVYLVCPDGKGGYDKMAGKSLYREPSLMVPTKGIAQSGALARFVGLPSEAAAALREAMAKVSGGRYITCVRACLHVMEMAGFTLSKTPISKIKRPGTLLRILVKEDLLFRGQKVPVEIIRTSKEGLDEHGRMIKKAEATTVCRKIAEARAKKKKAGAGADSTPKKVHVNPRTSAEDIGPIAPALVPGRSYEPLGMKVSKPSPLGFIIGRTWGGLHTIFEGTQDRVNPQDFFKEPLRPFPQANPSFATRAKKAVLFSRPVVAILRHFTAHNFIDLGQVNERQIYDQLRTHSSGNSNIYNLIFAGNRILIGRISVGWELADWVLCKHVLLANYATDVFFGSQLWKDEEGWLNIDGDSGTYLPNDEQVEKALAYARAVFPNLKIRRAKLVIR